MVSNGEQKSSALQRGFDHGSTNKLSVVKQNSDEYGQEMNPSAMNQADNDQANALI
jgi:hypothetical protein